jgi:protein TonB
MRRGNRYNFLAERTSMKNTLDPHVFAPGAAAQREPAHGHSTPDPETPPPAPTPTPAPDDYPEPAHTPVQEPRMPEPPMKA